MLIKKETDKLLAKLTKIRRKHKLIKSEMKRSILQQIPMKFRSSYSNILKIYTPANQKIKKK
jgi:hypothetical protein